MPFSTPTRLAPDGRLYGFLRDQVFGNVLGLSGYPLALRITPLGTTGAVWRCDDEFTFVTLVLKFYSRKWVNGRRGGSPGRRVELMRREHSNLMRARGLGLDSVPHRVVRPLASNGDLGCVLVEEFAPGHDLTWYLDRTALSGFEGDLPGRIRDVAWFLADLHNRSQDSSPPDNEAALERLVDYIQQLSTWQITSGEQERRLRDIAERWRASAVLAEGDRALIHGDATPTQFLFPHEHDLTVIDLEELCMGDRAADIGFLAGEIKHLFLWHTADRWRSEPYIRQLYADYATYAPAASASAVFTERGRFFMGCSELRIARNPWLDLSYRRRLVDEALECLRI